MKKWFNHNKLYILGAIIGGVAGFYYWKLVGCSSGTCMITSRPINSSVYGATIGALLLGVFKKENKKQVVKEDE
jgi:H+/Cl- antiporter ClcA